MTPLILVAIIFLCGLINSYSPKLLSFVLSFLPKLTLQNSEKKKMVNDKSATNMRSNNSKGAAAAAAGEIAGVFATFDKDGDGFITSKELDESLKRLGISCSDNEVVALIEKVDSNRDGLIDIEEFRELCKSMEICSAPTEEENKEEEEEEEERGETDLLEAFDVFDRNKDGVISFEELSNVLKSLGLKQGMKEEDCKEMIKKVDLDGDGTVNFHEFKKMMRAKLF